MKKVSNLQWAMFVILVVLILLAMSSCSTARRMPCHFERGECPNNFCRNYGGQVTRDYQIDIHMDSTWLWDGRRFVGKVVDTTWNSPLGQLILKDNL